MTKFLRLLFSVPFYLVCLGFSTSLLSQKSEIREDLVPYVTKNSRPNWLKLRPNRNFTKDQFLELLNEGRDATEISRFRQIRRVRNRQGKIRYVFEQRYKGIPVEFHHWVLHEANNRIFLAQGRFLKKPANRNATTDLSPDQARIVAIDQIKAQTYAWEVPGMEAALKRREEDPTATYFPEGELVWMARNKKGKLRLAYKFDIYSTEPLARKRIYVNARNGNIIKEIDILHANCFGGNHDHHNHTPDLSLKSPTTTTNNNEHPSFVEATGIASYVEANNGVVTIQTKEDTEEGGFILRTDTYGPNNNQIIHTLNANEFFNYDNLTEFRDVDNNWNHDPAAVGAHWGAAKAYDYFRETFDRKSYDDARAPIYSLVHYGQNLVNAYWDGSQLIYGDGNGAEWSALTSLDIIAHEFTHGVTENNGLGGLVYLDDSGALNESFSDIFGTVVEFLHHPNGGNWMIGEDFDLVNNTGFRNMANPHLKGHPKTYLGVNWYDSAGDNGGVHFNSGVQNHWFYLLCEGGSGTNEFGHSYSIDPIGMEQAAAIAYYNLTTYMTPNSTYQDARDGALDAALFLYPTDLSIHDAVEAAWCAVGIGEGCGPVITINKPVLEEVVTSGKDYQVEWSSELLSATSKVKIEYTKDTGDNPLWHFINDNISNTGTYDWLVPADYSGTVMVRVTDDGDPAAGRVSNQDILGTSEIFTIEACLASESFTAPTASKKDSLITFSTNVTGDSYEWTIDGQVIGTDADLNHTFDQPGIYDINYIVNSTANGCYNEESRRQYVLNTNTSGFTIQVADVEGGGGRAYAQEILQTSDGGYLFTTLFSSMVFKLDAQGDRQWSSNSLPTPTFGNYRLATKELENGNYLVAMGLADNSGSAADDDLLLIEIDGSDGSILNNASTRLAINGRLKPHQIIVTDSSYIIGGGYQNQFEQDIFIAEISKTDYSLMNQHWLGANNRADYYGELLPTSDGGFLMGWIQAGTYPEHFVMAKLDGNFQVEWKEGLFAFNNRPGLRSRLSLVEMPNCEGYMILATANEYANSALLKMNTLGNIVWAKRYSVPSSFSGQLIAFQDMTWDGHEGVTMIGINGTTFNSNLYPETVDYQILNVGFDGETNWQRKVTDLRVTIPSDANYNLLTTKILATNDGGYLLSVPGEGGGETHLIKTDSLGIDGCSITNTIINEEDISGSFTTDLEVVVDQAPVRTIQKIADYQFTVGTPFVAVSTPACGMVGDSLIAAFDLEEAYIPVDSIPVTTNLSRGATAYAYKVNGQEVASFDTIFANAGIYSLTLEATDGTTTTSTTKRLIVSDSISCSIACDFEVVQAYPIAATCPNSDDGQIYSEVSSAIGRTFKYALYNSNDSLLAIQPTGFFTNLATGVYQVKILADNDVSCVLEIEPITLAPKVDASPPSALCTSTAVNAAFVHAAVGIPYNHLNYVQEMQAAYDDDWHELTYEAVDPFKLFSDSYNYVYLEGSDNSADELEVFLTANLPLIENWVAAGNSLFLNAAPKEGDGMDLGFDGVRLVLGFYTSVNAVSPTLPMFQGPELPTATSFSGLYSLAAIICPPDMNATRILESDNGTDLLVEAAWGEGTVIFGGMNLTGFHSPITEAINFRKNIHHYLKGITIPAANSPLPVELGPTQTFELAISDIDLGSTDDCEIASIALSQSEFSCADVGIMDVILTTTDVANNISTCTTKLEIINPLATTEITSTICEGEAYDFNGTNLTTSGTYQDTFPNANNCDSVIVLQLEILTPVDTQLTQTICQGETFDFNGQTLATSGIYVDSLSTFTNCDSIVTLTLTVAESAETQLQATICQGDTFDFNGQTLTTSGTYIDSLSASNNCDSIVTLTLTVAEPAETQLQATICQGEIFDFNGQTLTDSGTFIDSLSTSDNCDSIVILTLTVAQPANTDLEQTICTGQTFNFDGQALTASGIYVDSLSTVNGCDSVVTLTLTVADFAETQLQETICQGETFDFNGVTLSISGTYVDSLSTSTNCDSVVTLSLTVAEPAETQLQATICQGDTFDFNGLVLSTSGTFVDSLATSNNCDSIVTLTLSVAEPAETQLQATICQGETFDFNGQMLTDSGTFMDSLFTSNNCDSIVILTLTVAQPANTDLVQTICTGQTFNFDGQALTTSGTYIESLSTINGCDSVVTLTLTVADFAETDLQETICQGDIFDFNGQILSTSGTYIDSLSTSTNCDSVVTLTLTVAESAETQLQETICQGDTFEFNGQSLSTSGTYIDSLSTSNNCDSIVTLTLTVAEPAETQLQATICQGEIFDFNGQTLTDSGTFMDSLSTSDNCDSIVILTLTVAQPANTALEQTICTGQTFNFDGQTLTASGTYVDSLSTVNGCDSVVTLTLTVADFAETQLQETICQGETFDFNGLAISASGTYIDSLSTSNNCDSIVTLTLTVAEPAETQLQETICQGDTFDFNGQILSTSGTYIESLATSNNCDSIVTLTLTVAQPAETQLQATICQGETFGFNGLTLTDSGTYIDSLSTTDNCDSIVILTLTVAQPANTDLEQTICTGQTFNFDGQALTTSGTYVASLSTINGCDSVVTLTLTVADFAETQLQETICQGDIFNFNGLTLSTSGTYVDSLSTSNNCDSIVTLTLMVALPHTTQIQQSICNGEIYDFHGQALTGSGTYEQTLQTVQNCDSTILLTLNVAPTSETQFIETICEGETYIFNNQALSESGTYQADLQNNQQCDSTVTLQLIVEDCASCPSEHLVVNGAPVPSGTYTAISSIISQSELALDTIVFLAGDSICLGPGFFGNAGANFTGEIAPFICDEPGATIASPSAKIVSENQVNPSSSKISSIPTLTVQPNPFYQNTQINFTLDKSEEIVLSIQTLDGQLVQMLQEGKIDAGQHQIPYQSKGLNGVYIIVLQTTNQIITQKMISLK